MSTPTPIKTKQPRARRSGEPRGIQSIEVGFRLIKVLLQAGRKLPLKEVAAGAGMPPSNAHLYLVSFKREGLVDQDPATGHYGLGLLAMQLGLAALRQFDIIENSKDILGELRASTRCSVFLAVWANNGPTIIFKNDGELHGPMGVRVGHVLPLLASSTGRVFLTYLPQIETIELVAAERKTSRNLSGEFDERIRVISVEELVRTVRSAGYAQTDSRMSGGFSALSAPVFDHDQRICAAVTLAGPGMDKNAALRKRLANQLTNATREISARLGAVAAESA